MLEALAAAPLAALDVEEVRRRGFAAFCRLAWPEADPGQQPIWSPHLDLMTGHLEAVTAGECRRLIINVPPGCSKSTITSVLWPAWDWIIHPERRFMVATFDGALAWRDALRCRSLVRGEWFAARWGDRVALADDPDIQSTQSVYSTSAGGRRLSTTVGGRGIGWHADIQIIDDPNKPRDVQLDPLLARKALERTWSWFTGTMAARRVDPKRFARVIIMQRLSENDLVGRILEQDRDHEWTHLMLPMRFEPDRRCETQWGADLRTQPGELLCPERFDEVAVAEVERDLGSRDAAAQLQQRPSPAGGNVFQRSWFKQRWVTAEAWARLSEERRAVGDLIALPQLGELYCVQSWDCAFKDSANSDYVAGHLWGYAQGKYYLLDRIHDRMGLPMTCAAILGWAKRYPRAIGKLVEDKANGSAVEQVLRDKVSGLVMINPEGGKVARANAVAPMVEAGNVILPDGSECDWGDEMLEELVTFPFARHDDDTDAMTQALIYLHGKSHARYIAAMANIRAGNLPAYFRAAR